MGPNYDRQQNYTSNSNQQRNYQNQAQQLEVEKLNQELKSKGIKIFDDKSLNPKLLELQPNYANLYAEKLRHLPSTQIRKFYDEIFYLLKRISDKQTKEAKKEEFKKIYPLILMLNSKVAYSVGKANSEKDKNALKEFQALMNLFVDTVNNNSENCGAESLEAVKLFFEAIVGYHRSYNSK